MRRLPVYFLLDTSGSMYGEPIQALNNALSGMINTLRSDAQALDSLWISIITYDREVKEIVPLTELVSIEQGNKSQGTGESVTLPHPPSEITVVI